MWIWMGPRNSVLGGWIPTAQNDLLFMRNLIFFLVSFCTSQNDRDKRIARTDRRNAMQLLSRVRSRRTKLRTELNWTHFLDTCRPIAMEVFTLKVDELNWSELRCRTSSGPMYSNASVHGGLTELNWPATSWPSYTTRYWSRALASQSWVVGCSLV